MTRPDLENLRNKHELAAKAAYRDCSFSDYDYEMGYVGALNYILEHFDALRMIESGMDMAAKYADNIIHQDMDGNHFLPKLSDLNPHLADWIESCWQSENDMWFVEHDDTEVSEMTKQDWQEIGEQVEKHFGYDVIEFEEPDQWTPDSDYLVCCYGSCINFVNWL